MTNSTMLDIPGCYSRDGEHGFAVARFFESMEAMTELVIHPCNKGELGSDRAESIFKGPRSNESWAGGLGTLKKWRKASRDGWPEGVKRMRKALSAIKPARAKSIKRRRRWADQGEEVDIHRVFSGNLDKAWRGFERRQAFGSPIIRVWIEASAHCGRSAESLFWRGAAGTAMVEALEEAGYRCEVWVFEWCKSLFRKDHGDGETAFAFRAKASNEMFDIDRFTLLTAHPSTLRTMVFAMNYATEFKASAGLGYPQHGAFAFCGPKDVQVGGVWNAEAAQVFVNREMKRFQ